MLHKILLLVLVIIPAISHAQQKVKFDSNFHSKTTGRDNENVRQYLEKDSVVEVKDYNWGKLYSSGTYYGFSSLTELDEYIGYKYNGHYKRPATLDVTNKTGNVTFYNKEGNPVEQVYYREDKTYVLQLWENGRPVLTAGSGRLENSDPETGVRMIRVMKDSVEVEGYTIRPSKGDTLFYIVDTFAYPKEGLGRFSYQLANNIEYPKISKFLGIEKSITIGFVVDEKGKLTEFAPVSDRAFAFEKNAIAKLEKMPAWNPATFRGRNVKTRFRVPITFLIE